MVDPDAKVDEGTTLSAELQCEATVPHRVHLVGVGGAGMSAIARILAQRGHAVSGSDLHEGRAIAALRAPHAGPSR